MQRLSFSKLEHKVNEISQIPGSTEFKKQKVQQQQRREYGPFQLAYTFQEKDMLLETN